MDNRCYVSFSTEEGYWSPCLRLKGHTGPHVHDALCNNPSCSCGGLKGRMSEPDRLTFERLGDVVSQLLGMQNLLVEAYSVEERDLPPWIASK